MPYSRETRMFDSACVGESSSSGRRVAVSGDGSKRGTQRKGVAQHQRTTVQTMWQCYPPKKPLGYKTQHIPTHTTHASHLAVGVVEVNGQLIGRHGLDHRVQQLVRGARRAGANRVPQRYLVAAHLQQPLGHVQHLQEGGNGAEQGKM